MKLEALKTAVLKYIFPSRGCSPNSSIRIVLLMLYIHRLNMRYIIVDSVHVCYVHLEVPVHESLAVQEVDSLCDLEEDIQTLVVLPLLWEAALSHPVLQVLLPTELHLDVQVHLEMGKDSLYLTLKRNISIYK